MLSEAYRLGACAISNLDQTPDKNIGVPFIGTYVHRNVVLFQYSKSLRQFLKRLKALDTFIEKIQFCFHKSKSRLRFPFSCFNAVISKLYPS